MTRGFWRFGLVAALAAVSVSAHAVYGWHSGVSCQRTALDAAAEQCSSRFVGGSASMPSNNTTTVGGIAIYCAGLNVAPSCADDPAPGSACSHQVLVNYTAFPYGSAGGTRTQTWAVFACDLTSASSSSSSSSVGGTVTAVFPAMTEGEVADYMTLWYLFLSLGVTVLCAKALYSRFRLSKYEG